MRFFEKNIFLLLVLLVVYFILLIKMVHFDKVTDAKRYNE